MNEPATRESIYRRLKLVCEMHTGAKQHNQARCFMVGREYQVNFNNLNKGDIQNGALQSPEFFYSERWLEFGKKQSKVCSDYPLVFITPGERFYIDDNKSRYEFLLIVFDLMTQDRNNKQANVTALRENEHIWSDTETIAREILYQFENTDENNLVNICNAGVELGLPEDPDDWNETQTQQATDFLLEFLPGNFRVTYKDSFSPFEYKHNDRLAGVAVEFSTIVSHDCPDGNFEKRLCL